MRTRWLRIAEVTGGWYIRRFNWGIPNGYWVNWRCRMGWAAPTEFVSWEGIVWALRQRLRQARPEVVSVACARRRGAGGTVELLVEVRRGMGLRLDPLQRISEQPWQQADSGKVRACLGGGGLVS